MAKKNSKRVFYSFQEIREKGIFSLLWMMLWLLVMSAAILVGLFLQWSVFTGHEAHFRDEWGHFMWDMDRMLVETERSVNPGHLLRESLKLTAENAEEIPEGSLVSLTGYISTDDPVSDGWILEDTNYVILIKRLWYENYSGKDSEIGWKAFTANSAEIEGFEFYPKDFKVSSLGKAVKFDSSNLSEDLLGYARVAFLNSKKLLFSDGYITYFHGITNHAAVTLFGQYSDGEIQAYSTNLYGIEADLSYLETGGRKKALRALSWLHLKKSMGRMFLGITLLMLGWLFLLGLIQTYFVRERADLNFGQLLLFMLLSSFFSVWSSMLFCRISWRAWVFLFFMAFNLISVYLCYFELIVLKAKQPVKKPATKS